MAVPIWPLALEPSTMTSRHLHYCGHPLVAGGRGNSHCTTGRHHWSIVLSILVFFSEATTNTLLNLALHLLHTPMALMATFKPHSVPLPLPSNCSPWLLPVPTVCSVEMKSFVATYVREEQKGGSKEALGCIVRHAQGLQSRVSATAAGQTLRGVCTTSARAPPVSASKAGGGEAYPRQTF